MSHPVNSCLLSETCQASHGALLLLSVSCCNDTVTVLEPFISNFTRFSVILIMGRRKRRRVVPGESKRKAHGPRSFSWEAAGLRRGGAGAGAGPMTRTAIDQGRKRGRHCRLLRSTEETLSTPREEEGHEELR